MTSRIPRLAGWSAVLAALVISIPTPALAQSGPPFDGLEAIDRLVGECTYSRPDITLLADECADAGLALHAMHGGIGLLGSAGGPIPASSSTAGWRLGTVPRVIADIGFVGASFSHPDLSADRTAGGGIPDKRSFLVGARAAAVVGAFNGFSPLPNVGGVLSVDLVAGASFLRLPEGSGFAGGGTLYGGGGRLGLVRESFALPGVTLSAMHYRGGDIRYGDLERSGSVAVFSPRINSLRATVGKDLLLVGFAGGIGRDQYRGSGRLEVLSSPSSTNPGIQVNGNPRELSLDRNYLFLGGNFTFVVLQIAGELVWSRDPSPLPTVEGTSDYRPGERELQGALSIRLTY